ncbi:TPA: radical SAM protein [Enterococcus faecium]|nr:radical SAM protein [Enterococcus faecium]HEQ6821012.1 radical SAM protein [Streptococcus pyogenes]HAQ5162159.1 radical SAM protein [Enterococcus faecium]HAQ5173920.1 radical SAM protein [Enterococcus faecium]HAQ5180222.1 radical SAM protein [Enterococcus faecium]
MNKNVKIFNVSGINIIGNFNNGAVIGLEEDALDYLEKGSPYNKDKALELERALLELGYYDETDFRVDSAYLHVNDRCNLHCIGCYSYVENRNNKTELTYEEICNILKKLKESGVKGIVISGGEPFLRDDMGKICRYIKEELRIEKLCTITNGTLDIDRYSSAIDYIDEFNISIDGYNEQVQYIRDKGIMPLVLSNIKRIKELTPNINLIVTLHKKNYNEMGKYNELAEELGVSYSFSIFTNEFGDEVFKDYILGDDDLVKIEKILMDLNVNTKISDTPIGTFGINCRKSCEAGKKLISIDSKGDIYPCHMLHSSRFKLGNALETKNIKELLKSPNNMFLGIEVSKINNCKECEYKYLCGGGCRGRSFLKYDSIQEKDAYCALNYRYFKNLIENII